MLMLTHTWFMKKYLEDSDYPLAGEELFAFNVMPDLLPAHRDITAEMTHGIARFGTLPPFSQREAFIRLHLLVDDLAHYGEISPMGSDRFLSDTQGYTYLKGKPLVAPIMDFYRRIGKEIDLPLACYRAHMIIEMAFDMVLCRNGEMGAILLNTLYGSLRSVFAGDREDLNLFLSQIFDINVETVSDAVDQISRGCTYAKLAALLDMKGRTGLYLDKFGLDSTDDESLRGMTTLLNCGVALVEDYQDFLAPAIKAIRQAGFSLPL
ncbi:MAG: hypothetical protein U1C55_08815 [Smithellaceae bacterium]|nr:hypothetical protein [Smithellaceae bacterium]